MKDNNVPIVINTTLMSDLLSIQSYQANGAAKGRNEKVVQTMEKNRVGN
jgi:hypothetical protein